MEKLLRIRKSLSMYWHSICDSKKLRSPPKAIYNKTRKSVVKYSCNGILDSSENE
jgi:hypothetical protein